jgi:hypothetical protein
MKSLITSAVLMLSLAITAAAADPVPSNVTNGDPKKQQPQIQAPMPKPTFGLTEGYFSLFNFFICGDEQGDTTRTSIKLPAGAVKRSAIK